MDPQGRVHAGPLKKTLARLSQRRQRCFGLFSGRGKGTSFLETGLDKRNPSALMLTFGVPHLGGDAALLSPLAAEGEALPVPAGALPICRRFLRFDGTAPRSHPTPKRRPIRPRSPQRASDAKGPRSSRAVATFSCLARP
eukprot:scaffold2436_cov249-Pinguiococcus_pyrenoidosus.AAC.9